AADPLRRSPYERDRPDSARGEGADQPVPVAPVVGARGGLHGPPLEQEALRPDPHIGHSLGVLGTEGSLGNAEELRSGRPCRRGGEQRHAEYAENDCETSLTWSLLSTLAVRISDRRSVVAAKAARAPQRRFSGRLYVLSGLPVGQKGRAF